MRSLHSLLGSTGLLLSAVLLSLAGAAQGATPVAAETVANPSIPTALDLQRAQAGPTVPASVPGGEALLFDNGPFVTNPGAGFGGADASAVETALGLNTYGFGHAISSGFRVADDFTVPAGGWTINTITFYAYQTGSTTTTTIDNINLRIWDGVPGAPGSNIVFGDTTTNRLASSSFTNTYRVLDTSLTDIARPIMASTVTVSTTLVAGTYWLDWQSGGTLSSGPWAIPVTILGLTAKPGANGMQFDPAGPAWGPLVEGGSGAVQDLSFVIDGPVSGTPNSDIGPLSMAANQAPNVTTNQTLVIGNTGTGDLHWTLDEEPSGTCVAPASVPWLSFTPASGTTAAAGSSNVTVGFDSTGLAAGTYNANLCVNSDDPDTGPGNGTNRVIVPVALTVTALAAPPRLVPTFGPIGGTLLGLLLAGFGLVLLRRYQR